MIEILLYGEKGVGKTTILSILSKMEIWNDYSAGFERIIYVSKDGKMVSIESVPGQEMYRKNLINFLKERNLYVILVINPLQRKEKSEIEEIIKKCKEETGKEPFFLIYTHRDRLRDEDIEGIKRVAEEIVKEYGMKGYYVLTKEDEEGVKNAFEWIIDVISQEKLPLSSGEKLL